VGRGSRQHRAGQSPDLIAADTASVTGDASAIHDLVELLDTFEFWFNIVTP
jgi:alkyl sulfatase BDS1-like metallo-beta-lactamase superfamily hydrolase